MRNCLIAALFWLATAVAAAPAQLAPSAHAPIEYIPSLSRFRRVTTEQGLSQQSAWTMVQDGRGFVWIGTQDGLNRFDGNEFRVYRPREGRSDSLPGNKIQALVIDQQGVLWIGSNGGLSRYLEAQDRFESVPIDGESGEQAEVRGLHVDDHGVLWIASYSGLSRYDPASGLRRAWLFTPGNTPPDTRFEAVTSDRQGRVWLASLGGLSRLDPDSGQVDWPFESLPGGEPLKSTRIDALLRDRDGVLWIGSVAEGLFRFDEGRRELRVFRSHASDPATLNSDIIRSLMQDRDGRLWIGTREGLNLLPEPSDPRARFLRFSHYRHDPRSLGPGRVMSLLQTSDGSVLAGTYTGGFSILSTRGNRFTSFTPDSAATAGQRDPVIYSLLADTDNAFWLGGRNGLYRFQPDSGHLQDFPALARRGVSALAQDGNEVWLGVLAGALVVDRDTGVSRVPALPASLAGIQITQIWLEGDRLIAGTFDRGVFVLRRSDLTELAHYPVASWVSQIVAFNDHTLLVCASDGLHWLSRDGSQRRHRHRSASDAEAPLPPGGITYFLRAADGGLWLAGAGSGLLRMHLDEPGNPASARFEPLPQFAAQGLDVVQALAEDRRGRLWLSSSRGIARFEPASAELTVYGAADGAFDSDYQSAAVAQLDDGRLAFAATRGFTVFDPERIHDTPAPPAPVLTELRLWNRRIEPRADDPASPLALPLHLSAQLRLQAADARMLSLRFSALELPAPERLRYAYRMEGFDPDWIETNASERSATYTNLAPGRYRFLVKAGEPGNLAEAATSELQIDILPPWWQTGWARALFALLVLASMYGGYSWRIHAIQQHRKQLQRKVAERTAELSRAKQQAEQALVDLRDAQRGLVEAEKMASLGSLVSGVAHEINTPLGNAVTASSLLSERAQAMQKSFEAGEMKRSELAAFLGVAREASALVDANLERTAQLVNSFKQISVDHHTDARRQIVLDEHLLTLLHNLEHSWKRRPIRFEFEVAPGLVLDTYPGALSQVVSQLIQNALVHAFGEEESGTLRLAAQALDEDRIELSVSDTGHGIPEEALPHVFEPFYTTRRGRGGTGLGLHLVYNLVTARLGGQIDVLSTSAGTCMRVRFPRVAK